MNGARCAFIAQRCVGVVSSPPGFEGVLTLDEAADVVRSADVPNVTVRCAGQYIRSLRHRPALADDEDITGDPGHAHVAISCTCVARISRISCSLRIAPRTSREEPIGKSGAWVVVSVMVVYSWPTWAVWDCLTNPRYTAFFVPCDTQLPVMAPT